MPPLHPQWLRPWPGFIQILYHCLGHQSAKFPTFDCSRETSPNVYFYFDRLLLWKVYKILAKKVQRSYVS